MTKPGGDTEPHAVGESRGTSAPADVVKQFALVAAAALLYFWVRGQTRGDLAVASRHGRDLVRLERFSGLDVERTVQSLVIGHHTLVTLANWVYIFGHWPVIALVLVWLFRAHRREYLLLRNALFISGAIGLVIFITFPVAPPRLLGIGLEDTVTQFSTAYRALQPPALVDKYAAMPSLHVGWNLLVGVAVVRAARRRSIRLLGALSPILMAVAVIATANHYVVDVIAGSGVALVGLATSMWLTPRIGGGIATSWRGLPARFAR